jgi:type VI secretion system lysozyme-like protein
MRQKHEDERFKPYILTRLTDDDPHIKKEAMGGREVITVQQLKKDIFENIEVLFNSRSHPSLKELKNDPILSSSVLGYGISDFCGKVSSNTSGEELRSHILEQLKNFEPRLAPNTIKVELLRNSESRYSLMEFVITAYISVGAVSEEVLFKSKLDPESGYSEIRWES